MTEPSPEFSRLIDAERLPNQEEFRIEANAAECQALAKRFRIEKVESLSATVIAKRIAGGPLIRLRGRLVADIVQTCGVTLVPLPEHVDDEFELVFGPPQMVEDGPGDLMMSIDGEDPPEPTVGGKIDIGEVVAEHLALAMDPFPRAEGAEMGIEYAPSNEDEVEPDERPNPFAKLAALKGKQNSDD